MSLKALGLSISFIWFAIYAVYGCLLRRTHDASLLPTPSSTGPRRRDSFTTSSVQIGLKKMHLRVQTTAWNKAHDRLASRLANKHSNKSKTFLKQFYNGGCFLGLAGMIIALGLLPWTAGNLSTSLIETSRQTWGRHEMADSVARSMKRTLEDTQVSQDGPSGGAIAMIKPIVSYFLLYCLVPCDDELRRTDHFFNLDPWGHGTPQSPPPRDSIRIHKSSYS